MAMASWRVFFWRDRACTGRPQQDSGQGRYCCFCKEQFLSFTRFHGCCWRVDFPRVRAPGPAIGRDGGR